MARSRQVAQVPLTEWFRVELVDAVGLEDLYLPKIP